MRRLLESRGFVVIEWKRIEIFSGVACNVVSFLESINHYSHTKSLEGWSKILS